jgi:uncharacterized protein
MNTMGDERIGFLRDPASYPEATNRVDVVETHMAYVFLTDAYAYKLKKAVRYDFLDFSTLALRKHACEEEVRLNRRLAPGVYLGTVPLVRAHAGGLHLGDGRLGECMDWLVKMRRLPRERMLDCVIRAGGPTPAELRELGGRLAEFYCLARRERITPDAYLQRFDDGIASDVLELTKYADHLSRERIAWLGVKLRNWLHDNADLLRARARQGHIVEAHGDLRPEHICLTVPPVIIDCIEFRRDFRLLDPADELVFLLLECERLGAGGVARSILDSYRELTGDAPPSVLIDFYACTRALLRAKLAIWHLRNGHGSAERWSTAAREYLESAMRRARRSTKRSISARPFLFSRR